MDNKVIKVRCNCGKEITIDLANENLDWEIVDADEREMGTETLHEAIREDECEECHQNLMITFHVWEYPEGFCNLEEILVEGGELLEESEIGNLVIDNEL